MKETHKDALLVWDQYLNWLTENPALIESLPKPLWGMEGHYRKLYDLDKLQKNIDKKFPRSLNKSEISTSLIVSKNITKAMSKKDMIQNFVPPYYRKPVIGKSTNYKDRVKFAKKSQKHMKIIENWVNERHSAEIWNNWINKLMQLDVSFQKLEWHLGKQIPNRAFSVNDQRRLGTRLGKHLIQFRSSGIRISKGDMFPTLVAIGQVPYTGSPLKQPSWQALAKLQSIPADFVKSKRSFFEKNNPIKRLGNAANCKIIETVAKGLKKYF